MPRLPLGGLSDISSEFSHKRNHCSIKRHVHVSKQSYTRERPFDTALGTCDAHETKQPRDYNLVESTNPQQLVVPSNIHTRVV